MSDKDLLELKRRFEVGGLYRFENERPLWLWSLEGTQKLNRLKSKEIVIFCNLERSKMPVAGFRVTLIKGEEVGFVLMKRCEVVTCFKFLQSSIV